MRRLCLLLSAAAALPLTSAFPGLSGGVPTTGTGKCADEASADCAARKGGYLANTTNTKTKAADAAVAATDVVVDGAGEAKASSSASGGGAAAATVAAADALIAAIDADAIVSNAVGLAS